MHQHRRIIRCQMAANSSDTTHTPVAARARREKTTAGRQMFEDNHRGDYLDQHSARCTNNSPPAQMMERGRYRALLVPAHDGGPARTQSGRQSTARRIGASPPTPPPPMTTFVPR